MLNVNDIEKLTPQAVRPALGSDWQAEEGYRVRVFRDKRTGIEFPMLTATAEPRRAFDLFYDLLEPLGDTVSVVLESSHGSERDKHQDFRRTHIDMAVLKSYLCEFEDLIINDGCTGVAVMAARKPIEVQFDEHKTITVYSPEIKRFRRILKAQGLTKNPNLQVISESEHLHYSTDEYADTFKQFAARIGVGEFGKVFSDGY